MTSNFITYRKFTDPALVAELTNLLGENGIAYLVNEEASMFNPTFYAGETDKDFMVKIAPGDFQRANELLRANHESALSEVESDHYLFAFTNEQLIELIRDADEWSPLDYLLAKKILADRGVVIDEDALLAMKTERLNVLRQPDEPQNFWIILGYITALMGGIIGIFIGWHLSTHKKTLPTGEQVPGYNDNDRRHGRIIFYGSLTVAILSFIFQMVKGWQSVY